MLEHLSKVQLIDHVTADRTLAVVIVIVHGPARQHRVLVFAPDQRRRGTGHWGSTLLDDPKLRFPKYIARRGGGSSQNWKTFLHNHSAGIGAMGFLVVPTVGFTLLFVLVILRHQRRRLISLGVTTNPTAEWIAHQITDAFPWNEVSSLVPDRDGA